ncbi:MAG: twin-arginine translocation signal domain-containing protein, partial [Parafilimonas terrae]|nr:twin-arginine translocation signal domain-containing protein [Parafilimonas terrae]
MAPFDHPFATRRHGCSCGGHASEAEHRAAEGGEAGLVQAVERGLMRAVFPKAAERRAFLKSVGAATAAAALSQVLPTRFVAEALAEAGKPEKTDLKIGFIPI